MRLHSIFGKACIVGFVFGSACLVSSDTDFLDDVRMTSADKKENVSLLPLKPLAPVGKAKISVEAKQIEVRATPGLFLQLDQRSDEIKRYKEFCEENPADCDFPRSGKSAVHMDENLMNLLNNVNTSVNNAIKYEEDIVVYGIESRWNIPKHEEGMILRGDCEDYSLQKRKILLEYLPPESLMIAIVAYDGTQTHAILVVRTTQGDYVLDNAKKDVKLARDTGYRFMFASNPHNDRLWSGASILSKQTDEDARNIYVADAITVTTQIPDERTIRMAMGLSPLQDETIHLASASGTLTPTPY